MRFFLGLTGVLDFKPGEVEKSKEMTKKWMTNNLDSRGTPLNPKMNFFIELDFRFWIQQS